MISLLVRPSPFLPELKKYYYSQYSAIPLKVLYNSQDFYEIS
jgi:hypothetical protein